MKVLMQRVMLSSKSRIFNLALHVYMIFKKWDVYNFGCSSPWICRWKNICFVVTGSAPTECTGLITRCSKTTRQASVGFDEPLAKAKATHVGA